jgi:hypothetical protein
MCSLEVDKIHMYVVLHVLQYYEESFYRTIEL